MNKLSICNAKCLFSAGLVLLLAGCSNAPMGLVPATIPYVYTQHTAKDGVCEKVTNKIISIDYYASDMGTQLTVPNYSTTIEPAPCDATSKAYVPEGTLRMVPVSKPPVNIQ